MKLIVHWKFIQISKQTGIFLLVLFFFGRIIQQSNLTSNLQVVMSSKLELNNTNNTNNANK